MHPAHTPEGAELGRLLARRLAELAPDGLVFLSPTGRWSRRSNYRRNTFDPAADVAGWPRRPNRGGRGRSTPCATSLPPGPCPGPGARIEDVSRLLGHSTVRVTQDLYISADGDLYDRFFTATE